MTDFYLFQYSFVDAIFNDSFPHPDNLIFLSGLI
jgi:hypothetical protein